MSFTGNKLPSRYLWVVLGSIVLITAGSIAGWFGAMHLHERQVKADLRESTERVLERLDEMISEAQSVFNQLNQLEQPHCSDEMLLIMRAQLFEARFIKDIGGIRNHDLHCSTALGRLEQPLISGPPDISLAKGIGLRTDRRVLAARTARTMVIEHRWFNVLVDPRQVTDLTANQVDGEIFLRRHSDTRQTWHAFQQAGAERLELNLGSQSSSLSATSCSETFGLCVLLLHPPGFRESGSDATPFVISSLGGAVGLALFLAGVFIIRQQQTPTQQLRRAIKQHAINAVYQPIVRLPGNGTYGFEALARWKDETGQFVPPETFISLAEKTGQIEGITTLMISQIGSDLGAWLAESSARHIAINIAPSELVGSGLIQKLDDHLISRGIKPSQITLEITERTMVSQNSAAAAIELLTQRGFRVFADDFGDGYCGLGYLSELHMHGIKISQTFTAALGTDSPKATLVPRIVEMAQELGLEVIVEGVETQLQWNALLCLGPILAQGWLIDREMPAHGLLKQYDTLLDTEKDSAGRDFSA